MFWLCGGLSYKAANYFSRLNDDPLNLTEDKCPFFSRSPWPVAWRKMCDGALGAECPEFDSLTDSLPRPCLGGLGDRETPSRVSLFPFSCSPQLLRPLYISLITFWQDCFNPFASADAPFLMPSFGHANDLLFPPVLVPVGYPSAAPPSAAPSSPALLSTPSAASSPAPSPPPSAAPSSPALLSTPSAASSPAPSPPPSAASSSPALLSSPSAASSADPTASPSPSTSALTSSAKRSREDICTEEVSAKRCKVSDTFDAPSTSSGSFGVRRFWERPFSLSLDDSDSD
ncbi:hypothetical protein ACER0C_031657 [Sarotherodon galilaeus]